MEIELGPLSSHDTVDVLGSASLGGTLRVISLGGFNPVDGDAFTIMTFDDGIADASDLSSAFTKVIWQAFNPQVSFSVDYLAHSVVLNAHVNPVPLPAAWLRLLTGIAGLFGASAKRNKNERRRRS